MSSLVLTSTLRHKHMYMYIGKRAVNDFIAVVGRLRESGFGFG